MKTTKTEIVDANQVKPGDTVIVYEQESTIGRDDIHRCSFMGTTIAGAGRKVERVLYPKWLEGKFIGYVTQP